MKSQIENLQEDKEFFQTQLFKAKKINKALVLELNKFKENGQILKEIEDSTDKLLQLPAPEAEKLD